MNDFELDEKGTDFKMKKILILISIIIFAISLMFWVKKSKSGNNIINQDNVKSIFNMNEYEAEIEVTVRSNKNENKYKIKQNYLKSDNKSVQEILEPDNLKGIKITKQNNLIKLENTELNLNKIFENYNGMSQNDMDLEAFIKDYESNKEKSTVKDNEEEMILETASKNNNKYTKNKTLNINKKTGKPTKMEIKDINKKITVYIVYSKVEIK